MLVPPIARNGNYVFEFGSSYFEVDPRVGARVVSARAGGTELLTGPAVDPANYGSTFWPSPQASWHWPPIVELDSAPYSARVSADSVTLRSAVARRNGVTISVTKKFTAELARQAIVVEYTITNEGTEAQQLAPWEITRVFPNGLTFYPTGSPPRGTSLPVTVEAGGHTWFKYDPAHVTGDQKLFADGTGGWLAHVSGDSLLLKAFADTPASAQAPGEAEIEIYANAARTYVEVEQQGAYATLAPGESSIFPVTWYVRKLPSNVLPEVGSADLIRFVSETLQR